MEHQCAIVKRGVVECLACFPRRIARIQVSGVELLWAARSVPLLRDSCLQPVVTFSVIKGAAGDKCNVRESPTPGSRTKRPLSSL